MTFPVAGAAGVDLGEATMCPHSWACGTLCSDNRNGRVV
jgi:hypothetical protein